MLRSTKALILVALMVLMSSVLTAQTEVVLFTDDFSRATLGPDWETTGSPTWGIVNYQGETAAWCAATSGADPEDGYPSNLNAELTYGPLDLSDAVDAQVAFDVIRDSVTPDHLLIDVDRGRPGEVGTRGYGIGNGRQHPPTWEHVVLSLGQSRLIENGEVLVNSNIPSVVGESNIWIKFKFESDDSGGPGVGALIDNVTITKWTSHLDAPATSHLYFPQFGDGRDGDNWIASDLSLVNPSDETVKFWLEFRDIGFVAFSNGSYVEGEVQPHGSFILKSSGEGPLQVASAAVHSSAPLAGYVRFHGSLGAAAITATPPGKRFVVPIEAEESVRDGMALSGMSDIQIVTLQLFDSSGFLVATASEALMPRQHRAFFLDEADWDVLPDFANFSGSLEMTSTQEFVPIMIRQSEGEISTLPTFPIPE